MMKIDDFDEEICSNNKINNATISDDEVGIKNRTNLIIFLVATTHLYKRSCPSVRPMSFSKDENRGF